MSQRPYQTLKIPELEAVFICEKRNPHALASLLAELLGRRSSARNLALIAEVRAAIAASETPQRPYPAPPTEPPPPKPSTTVPDVANSAAPAILSAWAALEVLSPQTYLKPADLADGEERRVAQLSDPRPLPWDGPGETSRPNRKLFYQLILGAIPMAAATDALLKVFADAEGDRQTTRGFAAIAAVTLDKRGIPANTPVAISSFAWGLPKALKRDLRGLEAWPAAEARLAMGVARAIRRDDAEGNPVAVDHATIGQAFDWLINACGLPDALVEAPSFALRVYHWWQATEPPDPPLLGSFFLKDLALARSLISGGAAPETLREYLGLRPGGIQVDVLEDCTQLAKSLAPSRMPPARWPGSGKRELVLLQQGAVNLATAPDANRAVFAVNGPPGTGKTTLLQDLVAAIVTERAAAMCAYDDPATAFTASGKTMTVAGSRLKLHTLDGALRGHELLVASSNNRAVENVSRELPGLGNIDAEATRLRYFTSISNHLAGHAGSSWGLIAGVLGNSTNRFTFRRDMWMHEDNGLRTYLLELLGTPQWVEEKDPDGTVGRRRKPAIVTQEKPPTAQAAARRWQQAKREFLQAKTAVETHLATFAAAAAGDGSLDGLRKDDARAATALAAAIAEQQAAATAHSDATKHGRVAVNAAATAAQRLAHLEAARPNLLSRLIASGTAREWQRKHADATATLAAANGRSLEAEAKVAAAEARARRAAVGANAATGRAKVMRQSMLSAEQYFAAVQKRCSARHVDAAFLKGDHATVQQTSPWLDAEAQAARDQLFIAAMALHRAFIDAAAAPLRANLDALFRLFFGNGAHSPERRQIMPHLWSSLFLVVPVLSTTFASVERMLGYLDPEALGWLLVDEAGQAVPQAAVGALLRAKRAVIVGDPGQIEPVTSLPTGLSDAICREFAVDPDRWSAPTASTQTLADAASPLGTVLERATGTSRVGWPLLVHRRCAEPQFSLSNRISYAGLMVHATPPRRSAIRDVLGAGIWRHVEADVTRGKWSEEEGRVVRNLLAKLRAAEIPDPDLFVISPFRIVAQELRRMVETAPEFKGWLTQPRDWARNRIGTIHTVQGREADSVVLVLGAPLPAQRGAREWAAATPNILNVAATRAKENFYVVGDYRAWRNIGVFSTLANTIPIAGYADEAR